MKTTNDDKRNLSPHDIFVMTCLAVVLGLAACEKQGAAEKAGQEIDQAAENAQQKIEEANEKTGKKIDAAKESLDRQADSVKDYIDEKSDASKEILEKAAQNVNQTTTNVEKQLEGAKASVTEKAQTAKDSIDDSVITMKVKTALLNDPSLKPSHIEVTTVNGVVKLSGTLDSAADIGKAIALTSSQSNVKQVQNDLVVRASTPSN